MDSARPGRCRKRLTFSVRNQRRCFHDIRSAGSELASRCRKTPHRPWLARYTSGPHRQHQCARYMFALNGRLPMFLFTTPDTVFPKRNHRAAPSSSGPIYGPGLQTGKPRTALTWHTAMKVTFRVAFSRLHSTAMKRRISDSFKELRKLFRRVRISLVFGSECGKQGQFAQ